MFPDPFPAPNPFPNPDPNPDGSIGPLPDWPLPEPDTSTSSSTSSDSTTTSTTTSTATTSPTLPSTSTSGGSGGGIPAMPVDVLKWLAALFLLWLILTGMQESGALSKFAYPFAGLILLGALYYMGPTAIQNIQKIQW